VDAGGDCGIYEVCLLREPRGSICECFVLGGDGGEHVHSSSANDDGVDAF